MVIVKQTYKDQVAAYLFNQILDGTLIPGVQIKESSLSAEMGISRAPIREALKELINSGLVEYRPHVGNFITQPSSKDIIDSYATQGILEGYAISTTCELFSDAEVALLYELTVQIGKYAKKNNRKMVVRVESDFHELIVGKCTNVQLIEYIKRLSFKLHILFYNFWSKLYNEKEIGHRHQEIVDALQTGDASHIERVVRHHYAETGVKIATFQND